MRQKRLHLPCMGRQNPLSPNCHSYAEELPLFAAEKQNYSSLARECPLHDAFQGAAYPKRRLSQTNYRKQPNYPSSVGKPKPLLLFGGRMEHKPPSFPRRSPTTPLRRRVKPKPDQPPSRPNAGLSAGVRRMIPWLAAGETTPLAREHAM